MVAKPSLRLVTSNETLCIGIDVSKNSHVAALISPTLLRQHKSYKSCPTHKIENNRIGFEELKKLLQLYVPLNKCVVLLEKTGHYHHVLVQYLQEQGIVVYEMHVTKKSQESKNDKIDALGLANTLYNQHVLGIEVTTSEQRIQEVIPLSEAAMKLRTLIRRRYELIQDSIRRKNKLTSICDEIFPEFSQVFKDTNCETALNIHIKFPTIADIAAADIAALKACRAATRPSNADLLRLKALAAQSIGIKTAGRVEALIFERGQLMEELQLLSRNINALDNKIAEIVEESREGKILTSFGFIGPVAAGAIIGNIGSIDRFENAAKLRACFGWAPCHDQTGISKDIMKLTKRGNRPMKLTMYLLGWQAIRQDTEWHDIYEHLIPIKCQYDARRGKYKGKNKVIGRVIGQLIGVIFHLLKQDSDLIAVSPEGRIPPPVLYDRALHRRHRHQRPI